MHKVYMNVAPTRITEMFDVINSCRARRDPQYFDIPYNRLRITDYSLSFIGPRLYNKTVHAINTTLPNNVPQMQNKFMDPFKNNITRHLLRVQKLGTDENIWQPDNYLLYTT